MNATFADRFRAAQDEAATLLSQLIRFNTSNPTNVERPAAEWVAEHLDSAGIASEIIEAAPGRASVLGRIQGSDPTLAPLLMHAHLDTSRLMHTNGPSPPSRGRSWTTLSGDAAPWI